MSDETKEAQELRELLAELRYSYGDATQEEQENAADRIESQTKRIEALEGAIAYALGRLEPESEGCPNSSELPGALRALADERAAWVEVAVEANKSLAALRATAELVEGQKNGAYVAGERTFGPAYDPVIDGRRIRRQMDVIRMFMLRQIHGTWLTLAEIEDATGYPQSSISAQLRHLRKERFGAWDVGKRRREADGGTWEYRVQARFRLERGGGEWWPCNSKRKTHRAPAGPRDWG